MQPRGGYKTITVVQLCNAIAAYDTGGISLRAVRIYFAAFAMVSIREAACRSRQGRGEPKELALYRRKELARLTGLDEPECGKQVRALARAGLIRIAETEVTPTRDAVGAGGELADAVAGYRRSIFRPVPIPRPVLRLLARTDRPALLKTLVGYLIRGLTLDRKTGEVRGAGSVKLPWLAARFGLSERAARYARRELIELRLLTADTGSNQRKLNRSGAYFTLNLDWSESACRESTEATIAPLDVKSATRFAPPVQDKRTSYGTKNQRTRVERGSGFCGNSSRTNSVEQRPRLSNIQPEDLKRTSRVLSLYEQAVQARWLVRSEANRQNFVAAAVRASRAVGDPARIFVCIVRRRLWHHITQDEEIRAVSALKRWNVWAQTASPMRDRPAPDAVPQLCKQTLAELVETMCQQARDHRSGTHDTHANVTPYMRLAACA